MRFVSLWTVQPDHQLALSQNRSFHSLRYTFLSLPQECSSHAFPVPWPVVAIEVVSVKHNILWAFEETLSANPYTITSVAPSDTSDNPMYLTHFLSFAFIFKNSSMSIFRPGGTGENESELYDGAWDPPLASIAPALAAVGDGAGLWALGIETGTAWALDSAPLLVSEAVPTELGLIGCEGLSNASEMTMSSSLSFSFSFCCRLYASPLITISGLAFLFLYISGTSARFRLIVAWPRP
mmetsp:Transcript_45169/g.175256  ORF Transcript_45169/g.175256 Transcript_45169/m.175256 type:complete len:238 (-) Transcript_45169:1922-2635(-)